MKFARVIGTVVSTQKYEGMEGIKFLVVQPLDEDLKPKGPAAVAADATQQAAPGELVFMVGSREGAQAMPNVFVPVDLAITGIVDEVDVEHGPRRYQPTAKWHFPPKKDLPPEKPAPDKPAPDKPAPEKATPKEPIPKKPAPKKAAPKKTAPDRPAAEKPAPKKAAPKKPAPKKSAAKKAAPKKPAPKKPAPKDED